VDFLHASTHCTGNLPLCKENQASSERNTNCGSVSPSYSDQRNQFQKFILAIGSCSFKAWTIVVLHGCSFYSFVTLHIDVLKTPVSHTSCLRDILGETSSLAPLASIVSSVSTVHFLSGFSYSNDPAVFSLLTRKFILCLLITDSLGNMHWNFLQHFLADSYGYS
jgi:predicted permease